MKETQSTCGCSSHGSQVEQETQAQQSTTQLLLDSKRRRQDSLYLDIAKRVAKESWDDVYQVGCVIVKDENIISMGWNGTPSGCDNTTRINGITKPEVIHSEANAITKLARTGGNSSGAVLYCTHSPCWECAKLILQSGIVRVVYRHLYDDASRQWLEEQGIDIGLVG